MRTFERSCLLALLALASCAPASTTPRDAASEAAALRDASDAAPVDAEAMTREAATADDASADDSSTAFDAPAPDVSAEVDAVALDAADAPPESEASDAAHDEALREEASASDAVATDEADASAAVDAHEASAPDAPACVPERCDDGNACTRDECMGDRCVSAALDRDEDGEGPRSVDDTACVGGLDCDDLNRDVRSGQTSFFATAHTPVLGGRASFDYNCDGREELELPSTSRGLCSLVGSSACRPITAGWDRTIPRCGEMGVFETGGCTRLGGVCLPDTVMRRQRCR